VPGEQIWPLPHSVEPSGTQNWFCRHVLPAAQQRPPHTVSACAQHTPCTHACAAVHTVLPHGCDPAGKHCPAGEHTPAQQRLPQGLAPAGQHICTAPGVVPVAHVSPALHTAVPHTLPPAGTHSCPMHLLGAEQHWPPHTGVASGQQEKPLKQRVPLGHTPLPHRLLPASANSTPGTDRDSSAATAAVFG
jgi:hypothetical protein